jgi:hypothetical protein
MRSFPPPFLVPDLPFSVEILHGSFIGFLLLLDDYVGGVLILRLFLLVVFQGLLLLKGLEVGLDYGIFLDLVRMI